MATTRAVVIGAATLMIGVTLAAIPAVARLERVLAVGSFVTMRGQREAPRGVVVVSIDDATAARLQLPTALRDWPRRVYADLIHRLDDAGASAVAFDIEFFRHSADPSDDEAFGTAIEESRRVVLVQRVRRAQLGADAAWERQLPVPRLAHGAAVVAAVPVPDSPIVTSFWSFLSMPQGDVPTLPSAMLQVYTRTVHPHLPSESLLNLYGPPGSICTIPFDEVLRPTDGRATACPLRGSAVFVGMGRSRVARADQPDTFHTVYAEADNFSGVELQATAFANLLTGTAIQPAAAFLRLLLLGCCGLLFGTAVYMVRVRSTSAGRIRSRTRSAATAIALAAAYSGAAYVAFTRLHVLVPLAIPVLVQLPIGLLLALVLPAMAREETVTAVCLVADAGGSTAVGDRLEHAVYGDLMKAYHETLCAPVRRQGGEPLNPKGDGFLCVWREPARLAAPSSALRLQACVAALEMSEAADRLNERLPAAQRLPTRIGIHVGPVTITSDADRGTYDVIGHAANVAARLQALNRALRTRVLASDAVVAGLENALNLRRLDTPVTLDGVSEAPAVFEICGRRGRDGAIGHGRDVMPAAVGDV